MGLLFQFVGINDGLVFTNAMIAATADAGALFGCGVIALRITGALRAIRFNERD
jgi:hypothetical protein